MKLETALEKRIRKEKTKAFRKIQGFYPYSNETKDEFKQKIEFMLNQLENLPFERFLKLYDRNFHYSPKSICYIEYRGKDKPFFIVEEVGSKNKENIKSLLIRLKDEFSADKLNAAYERWLKKERDIKDCQLNIELEKEQKYLNSLQGVPVTLYQMTEWDTSEYGVIRPRAWKVIFECTATGMGDAIRQANRKGIVCHNLDFRKSYPPASMYDGRNWHYGIDDLNNLDLEGLVIDEFPCAHSYNTIVGANLRNSYISLERPKEVELIKCDLRGAAIYWEDDMYTASFEDSVMDNKTKFGSYEPYQHSWNMKGTPYEKDGRFLEKTERYVYIDCQNSDMIRESISQESTVVDDIDKANVVVVDNKEDLSELAQKAKENGIGICDVDDLIEWEYPGLRRR